MIIIDTQAVSLKAAPCHMSATAYLLSALQESRFVCTYSALL
jgi:hypothetical protein